MSAGAPQAISSFEESGLRKFVLDNVRKSGYIRPTPIQKNAIPIIMQKMDLMACAQTGSGKTVGQFKTMKIIAKLYRQIYLAGCISFANNSYAFRRKQGLSYRKTSVFYYFTNERISNSGSLKCVIFYAIVLISDSFPDI